ncbi:MAG: polyphosphate kinase 1, partial [Lentisphaerae bacterium]
MKSSVSLPSSFDPQLQKVPAWRSRDLSWLHFNYRVFDQAFLTGYPVLERVRFLAITLNNLDEFTMVRIPGLAKTSVPEQAEELRQVYNLVIALYRGVYQAFHRQIRHDLEHTGIRIAGPDEIPGKYRRQMSSFFREQIMPLLVPMALTEEHFELHERLANLQEGLLLETRMRSSNSALPGAEDVVAHLFPLPAHLPAFWRFQHRRETWLVPTRAVIECFIDELLPATDVKARLWLRITRDADLSVDEEVDEGFLDAMNAVVRERSFSHPVFLLAAGDEGLYRRVIEKIGISQFGHLRLPELMTSANLFALADLPGFEQDRFEEFSPIEFTPWDENRTDLWETLKKRDYLLHLPFIPFNPILEFLNTAAEDPDTLAIRMTLYRVSKHSAVVDALIRAAENGKHVVAVVELKARFDESNNIQWAKRLEQAGVIVIYGIAHLKIHAKALLVIRREGDRIARYGLVGSGNFNEKTARLYTDFHLFTANQRLTEELSRFFNAITGYTVAPQLHLLAAAPINLRSRLTNLIFREIEWARKGLKASITAKINALVDPKLVELLQRAAEEGVQITAVVRGPCTLVPQKKTAKGGYIRIISILGRFLEHSRVFAFRNGGNEEFYLASADWMPRNLDRRVELFIPILDDYLRSYLAQLLDLYTDGESPHYILDTSGVYHLRHAELLLDHESFSRNSLQQKVMAFETSRLTPPVQG